MKKILTLLAGIVLVTTILVAAGCKSAVAPPPDPDDLSEVIIYLKDTLIEGDHHLVMYDSHNPDSTVIDNLTTDVDPRATVIWTLVENSGISDILAIVPLKRGKIMNKGAARISNTKEFKHKVPRNAPKPSKEEKYLILYKDMDGLPHLIDPQLKIPPQ